MIVMLSIAFSMVVVNCIVMLVQGYDFDSYSKVFLASYYETGDVFQMEYKNGNRKDYEVIGEALMPYALDYPYADCVYITVLVPEEEYITQTENESAMYAAIDAKKGADKQIKDYIDDNVPKENEMINVFSVLDMEEVLGGMLANII